jgi:26S proteasome regulatory subunit N9
MTEAIATPHLNLRNLHQQHCATQVEWMLMRAMSLGLLRGSIDEVESTVNVTWVQPRVLNVGEIQQLNDQLGVWVEK